MAIAPRWTGLPVLALAALVAVALIAGSSTAVVDPGGSARRPGEPPVTFFETPARRMTRSLHDARPGHAFYFTPDKVVLDLQRGDAGSALQLHFRGANPDPQIVAERRASGRVNYISGSERHTNLATYEQLRYRNLWPGIDMVLRGQGGTLKYEFLVRPGANPRDVRLAYAGADSLAIAGNGSLAIGTPLGTLRDAAPRSFQGGTAVDSRYAVSGSSYGFALGAYDRSRPLLIDPGLIFSTYLGGLDSDYAGNVVTSGSATFVAGETHSASFPTTPGAYDVTVDGTSDTFVTKLDASGALVYSTYLGGSQDDYNAYVAVDPAGDAYVAGVTTSSNFPTTAGAYDTVFTGPGRASSQS